MGMSDYCLGGLVWWFTAVLAVSGGCDWVLIFLFIFNGNLFIFRIRNWWGFWGGWDYPPIVHHR